MKIFKYCCFLVIALTHQKIRSELYVEPYVGVLFGAQKYTCITATNTFDIDGLCSSFGRCKLKAIKTRPLVGIKCGGWFSKESLFGLWLDCQYHHLDYCQWASTCVNYADASILPAHGSALGVADTCLYANGFAITMALPFAYRCGYRVQEWAPFGRLQMHFALGPGLFVTKQRICLMVCPHEASDGPFSVLVINAKTIDQGQKVLKKAACLVLDGGLAYFVNKHCAVDLSLRYRFAAYNVCACLAVRQKCHLGSANIGFVINF